MTPRPHTLNMIWHLVRVRSLLDELSPSPLPDKPSALASQGTPSTGGKCPERNSPVKAATGMEPALQWGTNNSVVRKAIFKLRMRK